MLCFSRGSEPCDIDLGAVGEVGGGLEGRVAQAGEAKRPYIAACAGGGKTYGWKLNLTFFFFRFTLPSINMSGENRPSYSIELSRIEEEEIFNKCLFKQISVHELKSEIVKRNISFSNSDSYHILTVKVKLDILEKSNVLPDVRRDLADEIASFSTSLRSQGSYKCCFSGCSYEAKWHRRYVRHL